MGNFVVAEPLVPVSPSPHSGLAPCLDFHGLLDVARHGAPAVVHVDAGATEDIDVDPLKADGLADLLGPSRIPMDGSLGTTPSFGCLTW